jgi:tryptophan 2,3-dioxygenase
VNEKDSTSQGEVEIPRHLLPALRAAAVLGVELACEGEWEDGQLGRVEAAVYVRDALAAGSCTREQVSVLASRAAVMQGDVAQSDAEASGASLPVTIRAGWPVTVEQAEVLYKRARLTKSLIELRDAVDGSSRMTEGADAPEAPDG